MSKQRHVIKRQIVEITLPHKAQAWQIQQEISQIFQRRITSILDRCLSEISSPDTLYRINCLELDLGTLHRQQLEEDILERFEIALRQALSKQAEIAQTSRSAPQNQPVFSHLELVEHFIREGYLPWWADANQKQIVVKSFATLLEKTPNELARLLNKLIQQPHCLQRLISHFSDPHLLAIFALLSATSAKSTQSLLDVLFALQKQLSIQHSISAFHLRTTLWQSLLQIAQAKQPKTSQQPEFLSTVLIRWFNLQKISTKLLPSSLEKLLENKEIFNNSWLNSVEFLVRKNLTTTSTLNKKITSFKKLRLMRFTNTEVIAKSRDEVEKLYAGNLKNRAALSKKLRSSYAKPAQKIPHNKDLATFKNQSALNAVESEPQHYLAKMIAAATHLQNFSDAEEIYIHNAGLCILSPFLIPFFEKLELVKQGHFQNQNAQQCAISLLHYLATGEIEPPEYLLSFNKLLCGTAFAEVFNVEATLTTAHIAACDELLLAVIANAPILNDMSIDGFRGSFLLRQGSLSSSSGCWLLRVERETYDLVLARFPWSWTWLNLPWMEYPLRVEW